MREKMIIPTLCHGCSYGGYNCGMLAHVSGGRMVGRFPDVARWIFPLLCMQCQYPPCVAVCRFGACCVSDEGVVHVETGRCVGCELCAVACPCRVRAMRGGVADGCDLCLDRLRASQSPYCVDTCPTGALVFGDLEGSESVISKMIREKSARPLGPKYHTSPRVLYTHADEIEPLLGLAEREEPAGPLWIF